MIGYFNLIFGALVFGLLAVCPSVSASEARAKFIVDHPQGIPNLLWFRTPETLSPEVQSQYTNENEPTYFVRLKGEYKKQVGDLLFHNKTVALENNGEFSIQVEVNSPRQDVELTVVDGKGGTYEQKAVLLFPEYAAFHREQQIKYQVVEVVRVTVEGFIRKAEIARFKAEMARLAAERRAAEERARQRALEEEEIRLSRIIIPKNNHLGLGLGIAHLDYTQTGVHSYSETVFSLNLTGEHWFSTDWEISGALSYATLPLIADSSGITLSLVNMDLAFGYQLTPSNSSWRLMWMTGVFYNTSAASKGSLGYQNLQGIEFYPLLKKVFRNGGEFHLYFKFLPIFNGSDYLNLSNSIMNFGMNIFFKSNLNGSNSGLTFDVGITQLQMGSGVSVQSNVYTLGYIYRF